MNRKRANKKSTQGEPSDCDSFNLQCKRGTVSNNQRKVRGELELAGRLKIDLVEKKRTTSRIADLHQANLEL